MIFKDFFIISLSLLGGYLTDSFLTTLINKPFFEISITYLIFFYWCYAAPQQFSLIIVMVTGFLIDFIGASFIGTHILPFLLFSLIIRTYAYRLRLFSHLQIGLIFALLGSIGFTFKYLFLYPDGYFYSKLLFNFISYILLWPLVYSLCRHVRRNYIFDIK